MKTTTLTTIILSSTLLISCGKKDDLNTKNYMDATNNKIEPIILGVNENGNCDKCDISNMTLTKSSASNSSNNISYNNIDKTKSYNTGNSGPSFDTGIRPTNSK